MPPAKPKSETIFKFERNDSPLIDNFLRKTSKKIDSPKNLGQTLASELGFSKNFRFKNFAIINKSYQL
jgi:hypothetical protein